MHKVFLLFEAPNLIENFRFVQPKLKVSGAKVNAKQPTVWKSKRFMDPLGQRLFQERPSLKCTRSATSKDICLPVPGYPTLSTNIMARIWNTVPGLQDASTLGAARAFSQKWAKQIPRWTIAIQMKETIRLCNLWLQLLLKPSLELKC